MRAPLRRPPRTVNRPCGRTVPRPLGILTTTTTTKTLACCCVALALALAGCGKSAPSRTASGEAGGASFVVVQPGAAGTGAVVTRNTTRLGGADPVTDAAAVARAAYPGLTAQTRPEAVGLADAHDWRAALAGAVLASPPLGAPLLYTEDGGALPAASASALRALAPTGSSALGGAQLILLGASVQAPAGYRARGSAAEDPYSLAASIAQLVGILRGSSLRQVIVVAANGPPALAMPAAGLAAESGAPILFVSTESVPSATAAVLRGLNRPAIYTVGSTAIGERVLTELARFGPVKRAEAHAGEDATPAGNAIAVARFADGAFGWGVDEPGHGLVFANAARPLDAPAAAILSATGDYGPLLLLEQADPPLPSALSAFLGDIQPAAPESRPVRGVYNHGWLIGDEHAISSTTQAELDALLEIVPHSSPSPSAPSAPTEEPTP